MANLCIMTLGRGGISGIVCPHPRPVQGWIGGPCRLAHTIWAPRHQTGDHLGLCPLPNLTTWPHGGVNCVKLTPTRALGPRQVSCRLWLAPTGPHGCQVELNSSLACSQPWESIQAHVEAN